MRENKKDENVIINKQNFKIASILTILFAGLKLGGIVNLSWILVLSPFLVPVVAFVGLIGAIVVISAVIGIIMETQNLYEFIGKKISLGKRKKRDKKTELQKEKINTTQSIIDVIEQKPSMTREEIIDFLKKERDNIVNSNSQYTDLQQEKGKTKKYEKNKV